MVGWHHLRDGHEFEQAPGVGVGQGSLACCRVGDTQCSSACLGPFEGVTIKFITSTIVWPQVRQQEGNTASPINRNLD